MPYSGFLSKNRASVLMESGRITVSGLSSIAYSKPLSKAQRNPRLLATEYPARYSVWSRVKGNGADAHTSSVESEQSLTTTTTETGSPQAAESDCKHGPSQWESFIEMTTTAILGERIIDQPDPVHVVRSKRRAMKQPLPSFVSRPQRLESIHFTWIAQRNSTSSIQLASIIAVSTPLPSVLGDP